MESGSSPRFATPAETVAFDRGPLRALGRMRARDGEVLTVRMALKGPIVTVADPDDIEPLPTRVLERVALRPLSREPEQMVGATALVPARHAIVTAERRS